MSVGDKIKKLRKEARLTQKELAVRLGVATTAVSAWERNANNPMMDKITIMAGMFNVPVSHFFDSIPETTNVSVPTFRRIPILGTIACGQPILAVENIEDYTMEVADDLPNGNIFALRANGKSMEPTIPNGSIVILREQTIVENGEIAAVLVNGDTEATLKRVKLQGDTIILIPDNNDFDIIVADADNPVKIIGKAISYKVQL